MGKTAIDAPRATLFLMDPDDLTIATDPKHPLFDPRVHEAPDLALVASIRVYGVDKPVRAIKDGDSVIVIDGRRRVTAAREAKRLNLKEGGPAPKVKVELHRGDERSAVARMVLGNFSPKEESLLAKARKAQSLAGMDYPEEEIATLFGVSGSTIKNWLGLLATHGEVQKAVAAGTVRLADAVRQVGKLPKADQPAALEKLQEKRPTRKARKEAGAKNGHRGPVQVSPARRLKKLEGFLDQHPEAITTQALLLLGWLRGETTDQQLATSFPELGGMFGAGHADRRAP
jgi:ParB family chromosome partitioning protein